MNTRHIIRVMSVLAVSALLWGCQPEDLGYQMGERTVTVKALPENPGTKVEIDDATGLFDWTAGDQIAVFAGSSSAESGGAYYTSAPYVSGNRFSLELSGTRSNFAVYPASIADVAHAFPGDLRVNLPTEYDIQSKGSRFAPLPQLAVNAEGEDLQFYNLGGLLRVTVADAPVGTAKLVVDLGQKIAGKFDVQDPVSGETNYYIVAGTENTPVTFIVPEVRAAGVDVVVNLPVPTGTYGTVTITAQNAAGETVGDPVTGTLHKKGSDTEPWECERAHGKHFSSTSITWTYELGTLSDVTVDYTGTMFESVTASLGTEFTSYKWRGEGADRQEVAVPYKLQYYYEKEGVEGWYDEAPDWLPGAPTTSAGSIAGEAIPLEVAPQYNTGTDPHRDELSGRTAKSDFDLSTLNVATGGTVARTTANCYVVSAPGTYKFPLVYGNGVKNGAVNESAYHQFNPPNTSNFLWRFKDHLNQNITTPYIASKYSGTMTAEVLWTDAIGLVTVDENAVTGTGEDAYISFTVPKDRICQGNALIALKDASGTILWSWQIWVTDEDLANTHSDGIRVFCPVVSGWCEGRTEVYAARTCPVRAVQTEAGGKTSEAGHEGSVTQTAETIRTLGNATYYQWGRKDPVQASAGQTDNSLKVYYAPEGFYTQPFELNQVSSLGTAIQNPCVLYGDNLGVWYYGANYNLWNSSQQVGQENTITHTKTVYDPMPAGFRVEYCRLIETGATSVYVDATETRPFGEVTSYGIYSPALGAWATIDADSNPIIHEVGVRGNYWYDYKGVYNIAAGYYFPSNKTNFAAWMSCAFPIHAIAEDFTATGENLKEWDD